MKKRILCLLLLLLCPLAQAESCFKEKMPLVTLTQCANQGDVNAQFELGARYGYGSEPDNITPDKNKAMEWLLKAAAQGSSEAQSNIGWIYYRGESGVTKDDKKAMEWFLKAAEQGDIHAQRQIGGMYYYGEGVPEDNVLSYMWSEIGAASGDDVAVKMMANLTKTMTPEQIVKAKQMAADWLFKHPLKK